SGVTGGSGCDTGTPTVEFLTKLLLVARSRLKSRARLEAENLVLRQPVIVLSRKSRSRVKSDLTSRWTEMLRIFAGRRRSAVSQRFQSLAGFIINTSGFRF